MKILRLMAFVLSFVIVVTSTNFASEVVYAETNTPTMLGYLPNPTRNLFYNQEIQYEVPSGTTASFYLSSGSLPTGLSLSAYGSIFGTPTTVGTYTFSVTMTNSDSSYRNVTETFSLTVSSSSVSDSTEGLSNATQNQYYSESLSYVPPTGTSVTYSLSSGRLPTGLSLSSSGLISGTPTTSGSYSFTVTIRNSNSYYGDVVQSHTLYVYPGGANSLPNAIRNTYYSAELSNYSSNPSTSYTLSSGSLPNGLSLSSSGLISGTPTTTGNYTFTVKTTNSNNNESYQTYRLTVSSSSSTTLTNAKYNTSYYKAIPYSNPYHTNVTYSLYSGALPQGLTLSSTGIISGIPTEVGTFNFTVRIAHNNSVYSDEYITYTLTVDASNTLALLTTSFENAIVNEFYHSQILYTSPNNAEVTFSLLNSTLPPGLYLSKSGEISGTPTKAGTYTFTVQLTRTSSSSNYVTKTYTLTVKENGFTTSTDDSDSTFTSTLSRNLVLNDNVYSTTITASQISNTINEVLQQVDNYENTVVELNVSNVTSRGKELRVNLDRSAIKELATYDDYGFKVNFGTQGQFFFPNSVLKLLSNLNGQITISLNNINNTSIANIYNNYGLVNNLKEGYYVTLPRLTAGNAVVQTTTNEFVPLTKVYIDDSTYTVYTEDSGTYRMTNNTNKYTDVSTTDRYYDSVNTVSNYGILYGFNKFNPDENISRGLLASALYNLDGATVPTKKSSFSDIDKNNPYYNAITWASNNGIIKGTSSSKFSPNTTVTREQLAAIIKNYANYTGMETTETSNLYTYNDVKTIASWALDSVSWALDTGVLRSTSPNTINPKGYATKADTSVAIEQFIELRYNINK